MSLAGRQLGYYVIDHELGFGAMGEVYVARHPSSPRRVALKTLRANLKSDEDALGRFFQEAQAVANVRHPGVVEVLDYGTVDGVAFFAMPLYDGEDLAAYLKRAGVSIEQGRQIALRCCEALGACHSAGVVHRDLKPGNIFVTAVEGNNVHIKILDFGLAKLTRSDGKQVRTLTGEIFGTPRYISPEQAQGGTRDVGPAADLYALGVVLYEMWTGSVPFTGTMTELLMGHITQKPELPSRRNRLLGAAHDAVLMKALEKRPADRYRSAEEFAEALRGVVGDGREASGRTVMGEQPTPPIVAPRAPVAAAPVAVAPTVAVAAPVHAARTIAAERGSIAPSMPRRAAPPRSGSPILIVVATIVLLAIGSGGAWLLFRPTASATASATPSPSPPPTPTPTPTPKAKATPSPPPSPSPTPAPTAQSPTEIVFITTPPKAKVERNGKSLGTTPLTLQIDPTEAPFEVEVHLSGYVRPRIAIDPKQSARHELTLVQKKQRGGRLENPDNPDSLARPKF